MCESRSICSKHAEPLAFEYAWLFHILDLASCFASASQGAMKRQSLMSAFFHC